QAQLARCYNLSPHLILQWRKAFDAGRLGGEAPAADIAPRMNWDCGSSSVGTNMANVTCSSKRAAPKAQVFQY
ncbi:MAG: hypothetical protein V1784_00665, partial [bacterium]